jgi:hypothetical protein
VQDEDLCRQLGKDKYEQSYCIGIFHVKEKENMQAYSYFKVNISKINVEIKRRK